MDTSNAPAGASPLWIIALFIGLSEATAGVAAIATDGTARIIFTAFAVTFPIIVFTAFTWLLINHTAKLYPPNQYSKDLTPLEFSQGVRHVSIPVSSSQVYAQAVADAVIPLVGPALSPGTLDTETIHRSISDEFERSITNRTIRIDAQGFPNTSDSSVLVPVGDRTTISELLDEAYYFLSTSVAPFSYARQWILETPTGERLDRIGPVWAGQLNQSRDERRLAEVGIQPGDSLLAVPLPPEA